MSTSRPGFSGIFFLSCIFLLSCSASRQQDTSFHQTLSAYFNTQFPVNEPGGAILVMKGDEKVFSGAYGISDVSMETPVSTQTLFNLGSISKTFVANAVLMLQQQGKLSVDDDLLKYFPGFENKAIAQKVKIKHLLTHTSGLPDNRAVSSDSVFYLHAKDFENWAPIMKTQALKFEPGSKFEYSNPAFNGLALIVEQVSGMKWQDFIVQNIMRTSGMFNSTITDGPHPRKGVAHAYLKDKGQWMEDDYGEEPTFAAAGNGGVWSSVEELAMYEIAIRKAVFLSPQTIKDSRTIKKFENWSGSVDPFIGWSWFIGTTDDGLQTIGHAGDQGGFLCNYVTIPEKDILIVILCNTRRDVEGFTAFITETLGEHKYLD
jgi:CubicO group peptidase (beta-lactamase class C family)